MPQMQVSESDHFAFLPSNFIFQLDLSVSSSECLADKLFRLFYFFAYLICSGFLNAFVNIYFCKEGCTKSIASLLLKSFRKLGGWPQPIVAANSFIACSTISFADSLHFDISSLASLKFFSALASHSFPLTKASLAWASLVLARFKYCCVKRKISQPPKLGIDHQIDDR